MNADPRITRTRERVMRAAYEVLTEVGFERATIELVSARSGVARSTLYRHWESREAILRDAFAMAALGRAPDGGAARPGLGAAGEAAGPPSDGGSAQAMLERYAVTFAHGVRQLWGRMAVTMAVAALDDDAEREVLRLFTDGTRRDLALVVEAAQDEGHLARTVSTEGAVADLLDLVVAPIFFRYQFGERPAEADLARTLAHRAWAHLLERHAAA